jgi:multidrug transporter EmrE-like cation transporter
MSYLYILLTILLTVYGQVVIKWQVIAAGNLPADSGGKVRFMLDLLANVWVISALAAAFLAALTWMAAMTRLPLSHAYPFTSLSFVLVLLMSAIFFQEALSWPKMIGMGFIVVGIVIGSQG